MQLTQDTHSLLLLILVSLLSCVLNATSSEIKLHFKFLEFLNPDGKGDNGNCCEGRWIFCSGKCDNMFTICLDEPNNGRTETNNCAYINEQSEPIHNENSNMFDDLVGGVYNYFEQEFEVNATVTQINHLASLRVVVYDHDSGNSDDLVESFSHDVLITEVDIVTKEAWRVTLDRRTSLLLEFWVTCAAHWYGQMCDNHCVEGEGNYRCDPETGDKICHYEYEGPNCMYPVTTAGTTPDNTVIWNPNIDYNDCDRLVMHRGMAYQDGIYDIRPSTLTAFPVWCDMSSEGWTIIQRRSTKYLFFNRGWEDYKRGYGLINTEYWLGLEKMYHLTHQRSYRLRITVQIGNGEFRFAEYDNFKVDSEENNYALHVSGYSSSSTAGDALDFSGMGGLRRHNGMPFSTFDRDNDMFVEGNCAEIYQSGWWFNDCYWANLNGLYVEQVNGWPQCNMGKCVAWRTIAGYENYSLLKTEMKILPNPRF